MENLKKRIPLNIYSHKNISILHVSRLDKAMCFNKAVKKRVHSIPVYWSPEIVIVSYCNLLSTRSLMSLGTILHAKPCKTQRTRGPSFTAQLFHVRLHKEKRETHVQSRADTWNIILTNLLTTNEISFWFNTKMVAFAHVILLPFSIVFSFLSVRNKNGPLGPSCTIEQKKPIYGSYQWNSTQQ